VKSKGVTGVKLEIDFLRAIYLITSIAISLLFSGCSTTERKTEWRTADEGSFTLEIPTWLHKVKVQGIDSHVGLYHSARMRLSFDEVFGLGYTPQRGKEEHEEYAHRFKSSPQDDTSRDFIYRVGRRYADVTVGEDEEYLKAGFPGKRFVGVHIPSPAGMYLSVLIVYRDQQDAETALRVAKSIHFRAP
jgi:hypothetical protein